MIRRFRMSLEDGLKNKNIKILEKKRRRILNEKNISDYVICTFVANFWTKLSSDKR